MSEKPNPPEGPAKEEAKDGEEEERRGKKGSLRDQQKSHLSKLMANPEKPVHIPEGAKPKNPIEAPDFVRFYMGSSAGAGSEVFHVYKHLRRKEYARQDWIQRQATAEDLNAEFMQQLAEKKAAAEEKTSKKRAKRLKRKQKRRVKRTGGKEEVGGKEEKEVEEGGKEEEASDRESDAEEEEEHFVIGGR